VEHETTECHIPVRRGLRAVQNDRGPRVAPCICKALCKDLCKALCKDLCKALCICKAWHECGRVLPCCRLLMRGRHRPEWTVRSVSSEQILRCDAHFKVRPGVRPCYSIEHLERPACAPIAFPRLPYSSLVFPRPP
jgi:hypothetical protein